MEKTRYVVLVSKDGNSVRTYTQTEEDGLPMVRVTENGVLQGFVTDDAARHAIRARLELGWTVKPPVASREPLL